jgi:hypothetical protein
MEHELIAALTSTGGSVIDFFKRNNRSSVILFIHGFTGGKDTWKPSSEGYFYEQLFKHDFIEENFDIAVFEYYTTLTNLFPSVNSIAERISSLFKNLKPKSKKNVSIEEISDLLRTRIRFDLQDYENIIVIAHSMGGLVAKSCILKELEDGRVSKIKLFISLAVPHLGADLATFGKLITNNKQIRDLAPLSDLCPTMTDTWVKHSFKPEIKYFYGSYDEVVNQKSAVGADNNTQDIIACDDDHLSISKPNGPRSIAILATLNFLEEFSKSNMPGGALKVQRLEDPSQYKDEIFVLKLLLADVHNSSITHSKEHFLNAEYARKLFSSSADQNKLQILYEKIRTIYQNCYGQHVGSTERNSTTLVAAVHQKIISEDAGYLKAALPMLQGLHKMGMLHQLANDLGDTIWWNENQSQEALENLRQKLERQGG